MSLSKHVELQSQTSVLDCWSACQKLFYRARCRLISWTPSQGGFNLLSCEVRQREKLLLWSFHAFSELLRFLAFLLHIKKSKLESCCYWLQEQGHSEQLHEVPMKAFSLDQQRQFVSDFLLENVSDTLCLTCFSAARDTGSPQRRPYCGAAQINPQHIQAVKRLRGSQGFHPEI